MGKSIDQIKRPLGWAVFAFCLASSTAAYALGFGAIQLDSTLNERLDARIPVTTLSPDERRSLTVRMATPEVFERFGVVRAAIIDDIQITTEKSGAGPLIIHLTSPRPVQEPFLSFLIAADTDTGRTLREYTVLLDPPGWARRDTPPVAAPPQARSAARPPAPVADVTAATVDNADAPTVAPPTAAPRSEVAVRDDGRREYGPVTAGDTLWRIARAMRPSGVTTYQMLIAIYRANPSAFGGDIDLLLANSMLTIPGAAQASAVDPSAARRIVHAEAEPAEPAEPVVQVAAPVVPVAAPAAEAETRRNGPAEEAAEVQAAPVAGGQLRLEAPQRYGNSGGNAAATAPDERAPAAWVGPDFGTLSAAPVIAPAAQDAAVVSVAVVEVQTATAPPGDAAGEAEAPGQGAGNLVPVRLDGDAVDVAVGVQAGSRDARADVGALGNDGGWLAPGSERDVAAAGYQASLLSPSNILLLLAAFGLSMALLLWQRRRQYKPVPAHFNGHFEAAEDVAAYDGAMPDSSAVTGSAAASAETSSAPGVSPEQQVQDAENQIAIGLFDQARETLEQGLTQHPGHASLQDKLLELDYVNGDAERFRADVERFRGALLRNGVRWAGISAMGRILVPNDPRFAFGQSQAEPAPDETPEPAAHDATAQGEEQTLPSDIDASAGERDDRVEQDTFGSSVPDSAPDSPRYTPPAALYISESQPEKEPVDTATYERPQAHPPTDAASAPVEPDEPQAPTHDGGLDLDIDNSNLSGNAWYDTPEAGESSYDASPDDAFDLDAGQTDTHADPDRGNARNKTDDTAGDDASSFDIDLSEFDLDRDTDAEAAPAEDDADPVEMRLDVARMYIEMQDPGSARGLLHEVIEDGDAEQRSTAQALLDQLG